MWPVLFSVFGIQIQSYGVSKALAALVATLCGVAFPLVIQDIIDGPITEGNLSGLWAPGAVLLGLGVAEAALFWARRMLSARPTMRVEASMRAAIYEHLQRLPVSHFSMA